MRGCIHYRQHLSTTDLSCRIYIIPDLWINHTYFPTVAGRI